MTRSLRAFLSKLIDYAGLFPPAALDLDSAIRNYARYRQGTDSWMLGRFIIPAERLAMLARYEEELFGATKEPFRFSVLAGGGEAAKLAWQQLSNQVQEIRLFYQRHGPTVAVEVLEVRLPLEIAAVVQPARVAAFLTELAAVLSEAGLGDLGMFVEAPASPDQEDWRPIQEAAIAGLNQYRQSRSDATAADPIPRVGFKLRCGGVTPNAFPTPAQIAVAIDGCRAQEVPLKCTAGLHHPLRHHAEDLDADMHGFLNVFGAGLMACADALPAAQLLDLLGDQQEESFRFTDEVMQWRDTQLSTASIERCRREFVTSFGSCSFDEPRDDLRQLGLMP
jgi:hypothetical protein